jgi:hypothetical protein
VVAMPVFAVKRYHRCDDAVLFDHLEEGKDEIEGIPTISPAPYAFSPSSSPVAGVGMQNPRRDCQCYDDHGEMDVMALESHAKALLRHPASSSENVKRSTPPR